MPKDNKKGNKDRLIQSINQRLKESKRAKDQETQRLSSKIGGMSERGRKPLIAKIKLTNQSFNEGMRLAEAQAREQIKRTPGKATLPLITVSKPKVERKKG